MDEAKIQKFVNERWKKLARHAGDQITMDLLVQQLREIHAAPPKPATDGSEMDLLRLDYQTFLLEERSLFHFTCAVDLKVVRRVLAHCFPDGKIHLNRLQVKDGLDFVLQAAQPPRRA